MNRTLLRLAGILLLSSYALANEYYPYSDVDLQGNTKENPIAGPDGRFFFVFTNTSTTGSFVTFNTTLLLFSAGIILWGVAGGLALYYLLTAPSLDYGSGYDSGYSGGSTGGYSGRKSGSVSNKTHTVFLIAHILLI